MLRPAIKYKEEIAKACIELYYTDSMFYYNGGLGFGPIDILDHSDDGSRYQFAIVDKDEKLAGYISYTVDFYNSVAWCFGLVSFDPGNPLIASGVKDVINKIKKQHLHRIEFRCIGGNPVKRHYDSIINHYAKKFKGYYQIHHLKDVFKDENGDYHDEFIYELIFDN